MDLERALKLALLLAPYLPLLERHWDEFQRTLQTIGGNRPGLLSALFRTLAAEIEPRDITQAFVLLLDRPVEWIAENTTPAELVRLLPELDRANDLWALVQAIKDLGLTVKYARTD